MPSLPAWSRFAISNASLDVKQGSLVALVGSSGSGKTTLLKTINRLVDPDVGEVRIDGVSVSEAEPPTLRLSIGYVFQGIGLFPHLRVAENIAVTLELLGWQVVGVWPRCSIWLTCRRTTPDASHTCGPEVSANGLASRVQSPPGHASF
jgi:ABC-type proline/glycine betaine transport system ATPase subunit